MKEKIIVASKGKCLLTSSDAAKRLRISSSMLRKFANAGRIPFLEVNPRCYLFDSAAVEKFGLIKRVNGRPKKNS